MNYKKILLITAIVVIAIGVLVYFNMSKENTIANTETYTQLADMENGAIKNDPIPNIEDKLRKRIPVSIIFRGIDTRKGNFEKVFSTENICSEMEKKEDRRRWWNQTGQKQLEIMKQEFTEWKVGKNPFRSYAIAIDITEGWDGKFCLEELLDEDDIQWIKTNDFSLDIFAIGYNEIPGRKSIKKGNIETIEKAAKTFFAQAPKEMPETRLLAQLHHIFKRSYYKVVCRTDLMENAAFSAYKYTGEEIDFNEYFLDTDNYPKQVVIKIERSNILGIDAKRQAWYNTFEEQVQEMYPETVFSFE
ncbi:MAG: hypothetical protein LBI53_01475 [Candidatus Peribacteria bacterium]|jgi:hypothetical protein|nr:hypothetical protein [Candidatus Peribacteria bacterium]